MRYAFDVVGLEQHVFLSRQLNARSERRSRESFWRCHHAISYIASNTYLSSLEERLKRMEAAMVKTSPPERPRRASQDLGNQAMVDNMSMLKIHDNGSSVFVGNVIVSPMHYIKHTDSVEGSASGFSIFSPRGLNWIAEKVGTDHFTKVIASIPRMSEKSFGFLGAQMWRPLSIEERGQLPPRETALIYVDGECRLPPYVQSRG